MLEKSPSSTYRMATPCASWLFQVSANAATVCLMAAVSASRLDAICARERAAEKVRNNKTVSAAFDGTEIIAHLYVVNLKSGLTQPGTQPIGAIIQQTHRVCPRQSFFGSGLISVAGAARVAHPGLTRCGLYVFPPLSPAVGYGLPPPPGTPRNVRLAFTPKFK